MPLIRWKILALMAWNAALILRLYHGGGWDLPLPYQFGGLFVCVLGSYIIIVTPHAYKIEGFLLAGLLGLVTGIPNLFPIRIIPDFVWIASGMTTLMGLLSIYIFIFREKRSYFMNKNSY